MQSKDCNREPNSICTCFQATFDKSITFSSFLNLQNWFLSKGLVNISANWSSVPIPSILMSPLFTWSLRKWWRISICFFLECWIGFYAIFTALSLSHNKRISLNFTPKSRRVCFIHNNWAQQLPAEIYSASAVEKAIEFYFFEDQEIRDLLRNWQPLEVFFLSTLHPA